MASADSVRSHSAALKKELGLGDLVLTQILYVVGSAWVGTAAKLGSAHTAFLATRDLSVLSSARPSSHLHQSFDARGRWSLPVGQAGLQPICRLHGRLESLALHHLSRLAVRSDLTHEPVLRAGTRRRVDEQQQGVYYINDSAGDVTA